MATNWLTPSEMTAWRSFIETTSDLWRAIEADLAPFGLDRGDYQLLAILSEAPDRQLRMCDLADQLRLTRSGLTRRLDGVLKKKLVSRVQSQEDGRVVFAQITTKGFDLLVKVAPVHLQSVRRLMIDLLTPAEIKAMGSAFGKISDNLSEACKN
jgi:DNA-binding MarR family transcriptional regulator